MPRVQLYCDLDHPVRYVARRIVNRSCSAHDRAVWRARHVPAAPAASPTPDAPSDGDADAVPSSHRQVPATTAAPPTEAVPQAADSVDDGASPGADGDTAGGVGDGEADNDDSTGGTGGGGSAGGGGSVDVPNLPNPSVSGGHVRCRDSRGRFTRC